MFGFGVAAGNFSAGIAAEAAVVRRKSLLFMVILFKRHGLIYRDWARSDGLNLAFSRISGGYSVIP